MIIYSNIRHSVYKKINIFLNTTQRNDFNQHPTILSVCLYNSPFIKTLQQKA